MNFLNNIKPKNLVKFSILFSIIIFLCVNIITNNAFFTFVTLNDKGKPVKSIEVTPNSDEEKKLYDGALRRRQLRLILAGKMKPEEADELKSIFN